MCPGFQHRELFTEQNQTTKKVRFITLLAHNEDTGRSQAALLRKIRQEFADATHNRWAFNASAAGRISHKPAPVMMRRASRDSWQAHVLTVLVHSEIGELTRGGDALFRRNASVGHRRAC